MRYAAKGFFKVKCHTKILNLGVLANFDNKNNFKWKKVISWLQKLISL